MRSLDIHNLTMNRNKEIKNIYEINDINKVVYDNEVEPNLGQVDLNSFTNPYCEILLCNIKYNELMFREYIEIY